MSRPIIEIDGVGKKYRIRGQRERYLSLRDEIAKTFRRLGTKDYGRRDDFWALRDISFSVSEGEAVGIIGPNGAGKSTLLKILSQITPPTEGGITMRGRVASLLEVGTGFHPELTGRENIYLNGAILGMSRAEVKHKFDEIVAFSEVEKFLDMPVKRYSSGMYVRLAFAVAAHLEPEILLVDEVLAVGDAAFQKKCLGKMGDVARGGRTVLFVSHNMAAVQSLCASAVLLTQGTAAAMGGVEEVTKHYLREVASGHSVASGLPAANADNTLELCSVCMGDSTHEAVPCVQCGETVVIRSVFHSGSSLRGLVFQLAIKDRTESRVAVLNSAMAGCQFDLSEGTHTLVCRLPRFSLVPGSYWLEAKLMSFGEEILVVPAAAQLVVEAGDFYGTGRIPHPRMWGICLMDQKWQLD